MGLFDGLFSRLGYIKAEQLPKFASMIGAAAAYNIPDASNHDSQMSLYTRLTWIANAIDFVANAAAVLDYNVAKMEGEDTTDIPNHPFEFLLRKPNPHQSRFEFLRDFFSWRKLTGNGYIYINRASENDPPTEMWIIPSNQIKPVGDGKSYLRGYVYDNGVGGRIPLETWQVLHDKSFNPFSPFVGLSAVQSLAIVSQGDIAQQAYSTKLFDKDNAKIPGAFAFADMINDPDWTRMQAEAKEKWGGMKRSGPMWLRGVGTGGVQWLQMALSQKDMEFIAQRQFSRDEVYSKLAPGLASVLDTNATEANALAGKAILAEYTLWPMLVQTSEKFVSDILPAYGPNLTGAFDDPRKSDRLLDLQEQDKYTETHTVNEVRQEYYGDDPIEGGDVPVSQWTGAKAAPEPDTMQPNDDSMTPMPDMGSNTESQNADAEAELKAWERFALKRLGKGGREFEPRHVDIFTAGRIKAGLKQATTPEAVKGVFESVTGKADDIDELKRANDLMERVLDELKAKQ